MVEINSTGEIMNNSIDLEAVSICGPHRAPLVSSARLPTRLVATSALAGLVVLGIAAVAPQPAHAQFVCDSPAGMPGGADGADASGSGTNNNVACGTSADASGDNSANSAFGNTADASGNFGANVASGSGANASGTGFDVFSNANVATGLDSDASGGRAGRNTAMGALANASGDTSANIAVGNSANAIGEVSANVASGDFANASGDRGGNIASGESANASGEDARNIAVGRAANASGEDGFNVATGSAANASGVASSNVAVGRSANASSGFDGANTAIGSFSAATGANASAFGTSARATHSNSAAFGQGAITSRDDQQVFGTSANTYTMPGIASGESNAAQGPVAGLVTTDANGNLASDGGALQGQVNTNTNAISRNADRTDEALEGVAISMSLTNPDLVGSESFAVAMNWGGYEGENALGFSAMGVLSRDVLGSGARFSVGGALGVGLDKDNVGGGAGGQLSW